MQFDGQPISTERAPTGDRIAIVDPQVLSRECLARVLSHERRVSVECYSTLDEWAASEPKCTSLVVLCQYGRSKADALNEVERLSQLSVQTGKCPAVILSDNEDPDRIVAMLGKSVRGYVPTSLSITVAMHAIDLARAGGVFVPASSLVARHAAPAPEVQAPKVTGLFTARQVAVIEALRHGKPNKIIAYELNMRESTVKVHVRNIMKKLRATNRTEVAYMATRLLNGEELVIG
jgi:DNA-binding NarL/FixJ family response regulator